MLERLREVSSNTLMELEITVGNCVGELRRQPHVPSAVESITTTTKRVDTIEMNRELDGLRYYCQGSQKLETWPT